MINFQSTATTGVWYRDAKVPATKVNKALGLLDIKVYPGNELQRSHGIVCNCIIMLVSGSVRATVFESKNQLGTHYLALPGTEKVMDGQGNPTYYENVQLKYELKAQVLKHVESLAA